MCCYHHLGPVKKRLEKESNDGSTFTWESPRADTPMEVEGLSTFFHFTFLAYVFTQINKDFAWELFFSECLERNPHHKY